MLAWYIFGKVYSSGAAFAVSSETIIKRKNSIRVMTYKILPVLRFLSILLLIIALARPGRGVNYTSVKNLGIDIMIALDLSGSMQGEDFQPKNRLEVAKLVVKDFITKRKSDRIGMVVFAGDAYLQCPLTSEHDILNDITEDIDFTSVAVDGTAIGDAIALASSRMMDSKAKSKIILLLTDGMNNKGTIDPETAAAACSEMGMKIYSVGIGSEGQVPYPGQGGIFGKRYLYNHFDETSLRKISELTGGKFYRAASSGVLWENIQDIDRLEKSEAELKIYHEFYDKFEMLIFAAFAIFAFEIMLTSVFFRKVP
jgi:Ca-activated chloride channel family protein